MKNSRLRLILITPPPHSIYFSLSSVACKRICIMLLCKKLSKIYYLAISEDRTLLNFSMQVLCMCIWRRGDSMLISCHPGQPWECVVFCCFFFFHPLIFLCVQTILLLLCVIFFLIHTQEMHWLCIFFFFFFFFARVGGTLSAHFINILRTSLTIIFVHY